MRLAFCSSVVKGGSVEASEVTRVNGAPLSRAGVNMGEGAGGDLGSVMEVDPAGSVMGRGGCSALISR